MASLIDDLHDLRCRHAEPQQWSGRPADAAIGIVENDQPFFAVEYRKTFRDGSKCGVKNLAGIAARLLELQHIGNVVNDPDDAAVFAIRPVYQRCAQPR